MGMASYDYVLYTQYYNKYVYVKRYGVFDNAGGVDISYLNNVLTYK